MTILSANTITRNTKDGVMTLVNVNERDVILHLTSNALYNLGKCNIFDSVNSDETNEVYWRSVSNEVYNFTGDTIIENGLLRIKFLKNETGGQINIYYWTGTAWSSAIPITFVRTGSTTFGRIVKSVVKDAADDVVEIMTIWEQSDKGVMNSYVTLRKGEYGYDVEFQGVADLSTTDAKETGGTSEIATYFDGIYGYMYHNELPTTAQNVVYNAGGDNYIVGLNAANNFIIVKAVRVDEIQGILDEDIGTAGMSVNEKTHICHTAIVPMIGLANLSKDVEDMTLVGATSVEDATAVGGYVARFTTQDDKASYTFVSGTDVPLGEYLIFVRAKQSSASVRYDINISADATPPLTETPANTTIPQIATSWMVYPIPLALTAESNGKTIAVAIEKTTTDTTNTDVDCIVLVPRRYSDTTDINLGNGPLDVAHQSLVNKGVLQLSAKYR